MVKSKSTSNTATATATATTTTNERKNDETGEPEAPTPPPPPQPPSNVTNGKNSSNGNKSNPSHPNSTNTASRHLKYTPISTQEEQETASIIINLNSSSSNSNSSSSRRDQDQHRPSTSFSFAAALESTASKVKSKSSNMIFGVIRQAKDDADNPIKCVTNLYSGVCNSICILISMLVLTAVPLAAIVIGSVFHKKCPIQSNIPVWLIVSGVFCILYSIMRISIGVWILVKSRSNKTNKKYEPAYITCVVCIFSVFLFIWFIIGSTWVYSIYKQVQTTNPQETATYCSSICYYFAFWFITALWILLFLILMLMLGIVAFFGISFLAPRLFHS